jgi:hypothetical protein
MRFLALAVLAAITTAFFAMPSQAQKEPNVTGGLDSSLTDFWRVWDQESPNAAITSLGASADAAHKEQIQAAADRFTGSLSRAGKYYGREEVSRVVIGSRLVRIRYFLRFENGPSFLDLIYYRPESGWKWWNFTVEGDMTKVTTEMAATHEVVQKFADGR